MVKSVLAYFNDDRVGGKVDAPGQSGRTHQHFDVALGEHPLDEVPILTEHPSVVDAEPIPKEITQLLVT